jgi:ABC-type polysaccharide/polyol phosphate export permease
MTVASPISLDADDALYDSTTRQPAIFEEFLALIRYRYLLRLLTVKSIQSRYKRSVLGLLWTFLNPLLTMTVLTIAFSNIFKSTLVNYPVYILSGIIFWTFFSQSTTMAINSTVWGSNLMKRIYVPRTIFPAMAIGHGLVNMGLSFIPLTVIMLVLRHPFTPALLFLPVAALITAMFALGIGLLVATLAVFFTDVAEMYQVLLSAWFYLTAVVYPVSILPQPILTYVHLNPIYTLLVLFRDPIYLGTVPDPSLIMAGVFSAVLALTVGWWIYTRKADEFAYRV